MAPLRAEAVAILRSGWLLVWTTHPEYPYVKFWCSKWPDHPPEQQEGEPGDQEV